MGSSAKKNNGTKPKRAWTKEESAEFVEHMESRGFSIVPKETLDKQNEFISTVTQGLGVGDPANNGRVVAVVWKDHLELLNTCAKVVLALGKAQDAHDAAIESRDEDQIRATNEDLVKTRGVLESLGAHLADKDKKAQDVVHLFDPDNGTVTKQATG